MPILQWSDVVELTHDQCKQSCLSFLSRVGFAATSWQEGSVQLAFVELTAEVWAQLSSVAVFLKSSTLNDTAEGEALTRYSASQYDNERGLAKAAQRRIALSCSSTAGPHTINIGDVVLEHPDGPTYRNIDDGVTIYPATLASGGSLTGLLFEAEVAGTGSNKAAGSVTRLVTTLAGVTVTSDTVQKTGIDAESDSRFRERNTTKWALLTHFELIKDAVKNIVLGAADGITIVEVDDQNPRGVGTFDVYVAGELSTAGSADVLAAQTLLDRYVMGSGAPVKRDLVIAASESPLDISGTVYFRGSYSAALLLAETTTALQEFIKSIPLGGFDFSPGPTRLVAFNDLTDVIREVTIAGQPVKKTVVLTSPTSDVGVSLFAKVVLGAVNLTFQQVASS